MARDESGATAVEYGIIAGLISVVIIPVLTGIGGQIATIFTTIVATILGAPVG